MEYFDYFSEKIHFMKKILVLLLFVTTPLLDMALSSDNQLGENGYLMPAPLSSTRIDGYLGSKIDLCIDRRIKALDFDQFVEPFRHRNETRLWQGEFWGKLMLAAIASYEYNRDPEMLGKIKGSVNGLIETQSGDGYIGNYTEEARLEQWDVWCRKYTLLALLSYYDLTGDRKALGSATKLADYTIIQLDPGKKEIVRTGNYRGMASSSILEPMVFLYQRTKNKRYLDFADSIVEQWESPDGPQLISKALSGLPVSERFPRPETWWSYENGQKAYEMMSCYEGLLELYKVTGERKYLESVESAVRNIIETEINISGSGSAFECWYKGTANQTLPAFHTMETCVTFTWMKLCNNLLRTTGNPLYADQIEKSAYNALLASMKDDGSQIAKYSPLGGIRSEGEKQCGMNINCCNANGPRGFMLLPSFSMMGRQNEVYINLYCSSRSGFQINPKNRVTVIQVTGYPETDEIVLGIYPEATERFAVMLRIPAWSKKNSLSVNGIEEVVNSGTYARIERTWRTGDKIILKLDLTPHLVKLNGHQAIIRGPLVLARDSRFSDGDVDEPVVVENREGIVTLLPSGSKPDQVWTSFTAPMVRGTNMEGEFRTSKQVHLCDFASAGNSWGEGSRYRTWLPQTLNVMKADYTGY